MKIKYSKIKVNSFDQKKPIAHSENKTEKEKGTIRYLLYFFLIVGIFIFIALGIRFIFLYQKSTFNTSGYSVLVVSHRPFIMSIEKNLKQITIIDVPNVKGSLLEKSLLWGIPIDAQIESGNLNSRDIFSLNQIFSQIFKPWNYKYHGMNMLDGLRITFFSSSIPRKNIKYLKIAVSKDGEISGATSDQIYEAFKDSQVLDDQKSIEIVNSTSITGLAGFLGRVLKNLGGNVVSIRSGEERDFSSVEAISNSETLKRISRVTEINSHVDQNFSSVADIQIILGKDFGKKIRNM